MAFRNVKSWSPKLFKRARVEGPLTCKSVKRDQQIQQLHTLGIMEMQDDKLTKNTRYSPIPTHHERFHNINLP